MMLGNLRMLLLGAVSVAVLLVASEQANAQVQRRQRNINRPTLSPWLDIFNRNTNPNLDNFHNSVRPRMQLHNELQFQQNALMRQNAQIRSLDQRQVLQSTRPAQVRPTGTGATFMNYSHYYPQSAARTRR